jgi:AraC-like DNA-binding protein
MIWLADITTFNPDSYTAEVVGVSTALRNVDSGTHSHQRGQLLYTRQGCVRVMLADQLCLLPPSRAAWIPANTTHSAVMTDIVDYRSIYFRADIAAALPTEVRVLNVSLLLSAVLEAITAADFEQGWQTGRHAHLLGLCIDEIRTASCEPTLLPLPADRRLARWVARLGQLPPELKILEREVGASGKTITRIFQRQTGMSYQQWRQQWRLMRAIELLATGQSLSRTAAELEFSSDSAFIAFFRKMIGSTPRAYLKKS